MHQSSARITAHDRRLAAIHEAGHLVVARHHGIHARAWIAHDPTDEARRLIVKSRPYRDEAARMEALIAEAERAARAAAEEVMA